MKNINIYKNNLLGKDYICGDIHGCYNDLMQILKTVDFNFKNDRLFCTGDLINKGEDSYKVIELFMNNDNFISVLGNHEFLLYDLVVGSKYKEYNFDNYIEAIEKRFIYMQWFLVLTPEQKSQIIKYIKNMPYAIEIKLDNKKNIGIIHADIPFNSNSLMHWDMVKKELSNDVKLTKHSVLWSKRRFVDCNIDRNLHVKGLQTLYCGHNVVDDILEYGNTIFLDTGCVYKYVDDYDLKNPHLTIKEII